MKRIFLLLSAALCLCACSSTSPKALAEKALLEDNGVAFTITEMVPVDTCNLGLLIDKRLQVYDQTIKVLSGPLFATADVADQIEQAKFLKDELAELKKELTKKLDSPAYIDYQFSAVPKVDTGVSYDNAYFSYAPLTKKLLGLGGKNSIHKYIDDAIPGFDKILEKAADLTKVEE